MNSPGFKPDSFNLEDLITERIWGPQPKLGLVTESSVEIIEVPIETKPDNDTTSTESTE